MNVTITDPDVVRFVVQSVTAPVWDDQFARLGAVIKSRCRCYEIRAVTRDAYLRIFILTAVKHGRSEEVVYSRMYDTQTGEVITSSRALEAHELQIMHGPVMQLCGGMPELLTCVSSWTDEQWATFFDLAARLVTGSNESRGISRFFAYVDIADDVAYSAAFACLGALPVRWLAMFLGKNRWAGPVLADYAHLFSAISFTDEQWVEFKNLCNHFVAATNGRVGFDHADAVPSVYLLTFACMEVLSPIYLAEFIADNPDLAHIFADYIHVLGV